LHPGLYRYNTPQQIQADFDALRRSLDHDQSLGDAYLAFSIFAATIRCGHTYANFFNQTKATRAQLFENTNRVPFYFRWLDGRMIVTRNFSSDPTLVPGSEIVAIDGIPAQRILAKLMTIARADGSNDAKRIASLEVQGVEKIETFDIFFPLFFPQVGERLTLSIRAPGSKDIRRATVEALSYAKRLASRKEPTDGDGPLWTLDTSNPDVAILRMPTWAMYDTKWNWQGFLKTTFDTLAAKNPVALVVDLRGNEGGNDVGNDILAHLIDTDLHLSEYRRLVRYRKVPDDLSPYLSTWDASFKDWGDAAVPFDDRFYRLTRYDDDANGDVIHPTSPRYRGRVFVLIGATNSSATFQFAQEVQQSHLATLVGQPTGGNQRGINGGAFFFLTLPNSKIELDVPLIARFPLVERPDAGITPDILVTPSADDIVSGKDIELNAVRNAMSHF
jgi:hypothetical protein